MTCWLCGQPIADPPEIIGRWLAVGPRVAHRACLRVLGEIDLDQRADGGAGPGTADLEFPGRP